MRYGLVQRASRRVCHCTISHLQHFELFQNSIFSSFDYYYSCRLLCSCSLLLLMHVLTHSLMTNLCGYLITLMITTRPDLTRLSLRSFLFCLPCLFAAIHLLACVCSFPTEHQCSCTTC